MVRREIEELQCDYKKEGTKTTANSWSTFLPKLCENCDGWTIYRGLESNAVVSIRKVHYMSPPGKLEVSQKSSWNFLSVESMNEGSCTRGSRSFENRREKGLQRVFTLLLLRIVQRPGFREGRLRLATLLSKIQTDGRGREPPNPNGASVSG